MALPTKTHRTDKRVAEAAAPVGLRERHKRDKRERISNAAITLFARNGYDSTTLREIATEADVALGTLSLYARDKRDLVLMLFNKVIPPLMEHGRRAADPGGELVDNLIAFFEPFYRAYAREVTLYRIVLGQIYNGQQGIHGAENDVIRGELMGLLADLVLRAIAVRKCRADVDPALAARCAFYIYFAAVRTWLFQDETNPEVGLKTLRILFDQYVQGLQPA